MNDIFQFSQKLFPVYLSLGEDENWQNEILVVKIIKINFNKLLDDIDGRNYFSWV